MGANSESRVAAEPPTTNGVNGVNESKAATTHPLGPLAAEEISRSSRLIAQSWPEGTMFKFKVIKLREPSKSDLVPYLEAERSGKELPAIGRRSDVAYYIKNTVGRPFQYDNVGEISLTIRRTNSTKLS